MNTNEHKRKTITVPEEIWSALKAQADKNGRTIKGELKVLLDL